MSVQVPGPENSISSRHATDCDYVIGVYKIHTLSFVCGYFVFQSVEPFKRYTVKDRIYVNLTLRDAAASQNKRFSHAKDCCAINRCW